MGKIVVVRFFFCRVYDISDPTQVDLTSNFFALCTNMNNYLFNYA